MRVVVMSDIHGFSLALDHVMGAVDAVPGVDQVVVAGDLCAVGPDPHGVLERLRQRPDWVILRGNTDVAIVEAARDGDRAFPMNELDAADIGFLQRLPLAHRIPAPDSDRAEESLLAVHANPHDVTGRLEPEMSDRALNEVLGDAVFQTLAFGHVHICYVRDMGGRQLVDVSAVGNPKDGTLKSAFGVFTWNPESRGWDAEIRRLPYPLEATIEQIHASGLPNPDKTIRTLIRATYGA